MTDDIRERIALVIESELSRLRSDPLTTPAVVAAYRHAAAIARQTSAETRARCPACERFRQTKSDGKWWECRSCPAQGCDDCIIDNRCENCQK